MTEEIRFQTGFRAAASGEPGLVLHDDGTVWLVNPDSSETQLGGGGGGLPAWWIVDETAQTVTVQFADDPDGDYFGLTVEALGQFDGFTGVQVIGDSLDQLVSLAYFGPDIGLSANAPGRSSVVGPGYGAFLDGDNDDIVLIASHGNDTDRTQDLAQIYKNQGAAMLWGINKSGLEYKKNLGFTAPDDGDVEPSEILEWFDDTENAIAARFKAQDSAGNPFAGKVATMLPDGSAFTGVDLPLLVAIPTPTQISTVLAGLGLTRQS